MPCAHYPETEAKIMPDPEFTLASGTSSWMQAFALDPLKDEIFMTRNIRTSNGRERSGSTGSARLTIRAYGASSHR